MTLPAKFTAEASLPILLRGVPLTFTVGARPSVAGLFSGKTITVYLDSEATGERVTVTEQVGTGTGTFEATGLTHSDDESEFTVNLEDTEQLEDGVVYKIVAVVEVPGGAKEIVGPWDLPVQTMPAGLV